MSIRERIARWIAPDAFAKLERDLDWESKFNRMKEGIIRQLWAKIGKLENQLKESHRDIINIRNRSAR